MRRVSWLAAVVLGIALWWWWDGSSPTPTRAGDPPQLTVVASESGPRPSASKHEQRDLPWGNAPEQVGRLRRIEANAEGPMALGKRGSQSWILDQLNGRLVRLDANASTISVPLPLHDAVDLVVGEGRVYVLDRSTDKAMAVLDGEGHEIRRVTLPAALSGPAVTSMRVTAGRVWIERRHETLHAVADLDGRQVAEESVPGRVSHDGKHVLRVQLVQGRVALRWMQREPQQLVFAREVSFDHPVLYVLDADSDDSDTIYLAVLLETGGESSEAQVYCFSAAGELLSQQTLPSYPMPEEMFRRFAVDPEGGFIYAYADELGYHTLQGRCR